MNREKMLEVIEQYKSLLLHIPPATGPMDRQPSPREAFEHVHNMLEQIEEWLADEHLDVVDPKAWDKANRWLGFLQGVFWMQGTYTLNQMRDHNRIESPVETLFSASPEELGKAAIEEARQR